LNHLLKRDSEIFMVVLIHDGELIGEKNDDPTAFFEQRKKNVQKNTPCPFNPCNV
jgi:hypothetical protein